MAGNIVLMTIGCLALMMVVTAKQWTARVGSPPLSWRGMTQSSAPLPAPTSTPARRSSVKRPARTPPAVARTRAGLHQAARSIAMAGTAARPEGSVSANVFPEFGWAVFPVSKVPNWGAMHTPKQWERTYDEMMAADFVDVPPYNLQILETPMTSLTKNINSRTIPKITQKLTYSTHYFGAYDVDASEFTGNHPGVDIKLALDTPLRAIGGGRVSAVTNDDEGLGLYVTIEHRLPGEGTFFSIYGHMGTVNVKPGDAVTAGENIGTVGMTGKTTGPHVHLQVDIGQPNEDHLPYSPSVLPGPAEAEKWVVNPLDFIAAHAL